MADIELLQINPANVLMVAVRLNDWEVLGYGNGWIEYRQILPLPQTVLNIGRFADLNNIVEFVNGDQFTPEFRLAGLLYSGDPGQGGALVGASQPLLYRISERRALNGTGFPRSGGRARFREPPIPVTGDGLAQSDGAAHLSQAHAVTGSGAGRSDGSLELDTAEVLHYVTAQGRGRSDGSLDLTKIGELQVTAEGLARSDGSLAMERLASLPLTAEGQALSDGTADLRLRQSVTESVTARGAGSSGGRLRLRVLRPRITLAGLTLTNVEAALRDWLREQTEVSGVVGNKVFLGIPAEVSKSERQYPLVGIHRISGVLSDYTSLDSADLQIDCWGPMKSQRSAQETAALIASALKAMVPNTRLNDEVLVKGIYNIGAAWLPDPVSDRPRYVITATVQAVNT